MELMRIASKMMNLFMTLVLILFAFMKLGVFVSRIFMAITRKNNYSGTSELFNSFMLFYEFFGFLLFLKLLFEGIIFLINNKIKSELYLVPIFICSVYYPLLVLFRYLVVGNRAFHFLFPIYFAEGVLIFLGLYFYIYSKITKNYQ